MRTSNAVMMSVGLLLIGATSALSLSKGSGITRSPVAPRIHGTQAPNPARTPPLKAGQATITRAGLTATLMLENGILSPETQRVLAMLQLRTGTSTGAVHVPAAVAIVLDVSGSMVGDKLKDAKKSAKKLIASLSNGDRVSIISFAEEAQTHLSNITLTDNRAEVLNVIDGIDVRGTTCISCGLEQGYTALGKAPGNYQRRVILLSDGQANQGLQGVSSLGSLSSSARNRDVVTSTIGLGAGYDAPVMNAIAESGAGRYYFVHNATAIKAVLDAELVQIRTAMVRDLKVELRSVEGTLLGTIDSPNVWLGSHNETVGPMAAKSERRVLVPLKLPRNYAGKVVTAVVTYNDLQNIQHTLTLTANVGRSSDPAAIHASRNGAVVAHAARLKSVRIVERALKYKGEGRTEDAVRLLDSAAKDMKKVAQDTGDDDAAAEADELNVLRGKVQTFKTGSRQMRATTLLNSARKAEVLKGAPAAGSFHKNGMYNEDKTQ